MESISNRIFRLMAEKDISQHDFSVASGIPQSTISNWKKKHTNPSADKILIICDVLEVSPYELLSGVKTNDGRKSPEKRYLIDADSQLGVIVETIQGLSDASFHRLRGYLDALRMNEKE